MLTLRYPFEAGGPERLQVEIGSFSSRVKITVDGQLLEEVYTGRRGLKRDFQLSDGSQLSVRSSPFNSISVMRNSVPLPGSSGDPAHQVKQAAIALYIVASLTGFIALLALAGVNAFSKLGIDAWALGDAAIFAILGLFTQRGSRVAVIIGTVLFIGESLYQLANGVGVAPGPIVIKFIIGVTLIKGIRAAFLLRRLKISNS